MNTLIEILIALLIINAISGIIKIISIAKLIHDYEGQWSVPGFFCEMTNIAITIIAVVLVYRGYLL